MISVEDLREHFQYNPESGLITWIKVPSPKAQVKVGDVAGCLDSKGYLVVKFRQKLLKQHRIAWALMTGSWPDGLLDHANGCRNDNRWSNLRIANRSQNTANSRKYRGILPKGVHVSWARFAASIRINGNSIYLGSFDTAEQAHEAYKQAAIKYHGEFARFE